MIVGSFILLLFCIPGTLAEYNITEGEELCKRIEKTSDMYSFCVSTVKAVRSYEAFFDKYHFGSPDMLNALTDLQHEVLNEICDRFNGCPVTNKVNCFLPRMDTKMICKKCKVLRTPFGKCMKKFMTQKPIDGALESFFKDFTNHGVAKKCIDLRFPNAVMAAIYFECGETAEVSFNKNNHELRYVYGC